MVIASVSPSSSEAAGEPTGFLDRTLDVDGVPRRYQVYVPRAYASSDEPMPVILFLHGSGEKGIDGILPTEIGLGTALRRHPERYPAIVVFAQTPGIWQEEGARIALAELDRTMSEFRVDPARVYLLGMSMGGNGAWYLAYHHPDRFAAAAITCGFIREHRDGLYPALVPEAADPFATVAERVRDLPLWLAHGDADTVVPVEETRSMVAALESIGADVHSTEIPGGGHNSWDPAFQGEELPAWLFRQRKDPGEASSRAKETE
jgi:predicted peptidase